MSRYHAQLEVEDESGEMEQWEIVFKRVSTADMLTLTDILDAKDTSAIQKMLIASDYLVKSYTLDGTCYAVNQVPFDVMSLAVGKSPFLP